MDTPPNLSKEASDFLLELASGKHDKEVVFVKRILTSIAPIWPPAEGLSHAISVFLWLNKMTAPQGGVVPDGRGGFVPASNSRIGSDGNFL